MTILLDGRSVSEKLMKEMLPEVETLKRMGVTPQLAVINLGEDHASKVYVRRKIEACESLGIAVRHEQLPEETDERSLLGMIDGMNRDGSIHGILVQLPLPPAIDKVKVIEAIDPAKDVDGFHPFNVGRVSTGTGGFMPCTPKGILALLDHYSLEVAGREAVVVGASNIVGRPMAALLGIREATVTLCHIKTRDLEYHTRRAELLVVGAGVPRIIKPDMVMDGAVLIDVGINPVEDENGGVHIAGDIDPEASGKALAWTPVPGGVGPMTVAMLMQNTLLAAEGSA